MSRRRWRRWQSNATIRGRRSTAVSAFAITGGRHPVVEQALIASGGPFVANDCDLSPPPPPILPRKRGRTGGAGPYLADHRAEHGRKIDLPAPERADCRAGPDGQLRARQGRAYRHRRSPVLAGRRRRRSGARPFDLHGRDGRDRGDPQSGRRARSGHFRRDRPRHGDLRRPIDRLGDHRASAREQSLPRAVCHPFPRNDSARGKAAAAAQCHDAGEGMARRRRVPA